MKVGFYAGWNEKRRLIGERFAEGVRRHGDSIELRDVGAEVGADDDVAVLIGNKVRLAVRPGVKVVHLDKSYPAANLRRDHDYARVSIDAVHPSRYLCQLGMPADRRERLGWQPVPWRRSGDRVLVLGGSRSFYERTGIADIQEHLQGIVELVHRATKLRVQFRPKPNMARFLGPMRNAEQVDPYAFLGPILEGCRSVVVEESAVSIEALLCGVPTIALGDAPTRPISSPYIRQVEDPYLASNESVVALLNDLAYFQYSQGEFVDGTAWEFIRRLL